MNIFSFHVNFEISIVVCGNLKGAIDQSRSRNDSGIALDESFVQVLPTDEMGVDAYRQLVCRVSLNLD